MHGPPTIDTDVQKPALQRLARYEIGGVCVALRGDCRRAAADLLEYRWLRLERSKRHPQVTYDLLFAPRRKRLVRNGRSLSSSRYPEDVLHDLEVDVYRQVSLLSRMTPLHAGGVVLEGGAVLLVGDSGAGKSSLTLELLRRHGLYLGDEHIFVGPDARAHGLARAIQFVPVWGSARSGILPTSEEVCHAPQPIRLVVLLRQARSKEDSLVPVSHAEAAVRLISCLHRPPHPDDLRNLARLAAEVPVRYLAQEEISTAAEIILDTVAELPVVPGSATVQGSGDDGMPSS